MPTTYAYKVRDKENRLLQGSLEADSTALVASRLQSMGYVPVSIEKVAGGGFSMELKIRGHQC